MYTYNYNQYLPLQLRIRCTSIYLFWLCATQLQTPLGSSQYTKLYNTKQEPKKTQIRAEKREKEQDDESYRYTKTSHLTFNRGGSRH